MYRLPQDHELSRRWTSIGLGFALIAGMYYWNEWKEWKEKTKRTEAAEFRRSEYRIQQMQTEAARNMFSDPNSRFRQEMEKNAKLQEALDQAMKK
jgi:hypothetical protein